MPKNIIFEDEDDEEHYNSMTAEGKAMFDNAFKYLHLENEPPPPEKPKKVKVHADTIELNFIRAELARMIKNSELVVSDCDAILIRIQSMEKYIKSDTKVARGIHQNIITRIQRILDGLPAFEHHVKLDDED